MTQQTAPATAEANGSPPAEQIAAHPDAGTGTLDERLARIVGTLRVIANAKMKTGGKEWAYATIDQMAGAIGPLLSAERVTISPVGIEDLNERELVRQKKSDDGPYEQIRHLTSMTVVWRVAGGGESFEARSRGKSADADGSEKDANQAHSFARINLYKSLFHLVTGEDPERKGGGGGGSGSGPQHSGELPDVTGATVNGSVVMSDDGTQVGLDYTIEPRPVQVEVNRYTVQVLGGQWNRDGKLYAIPSEHAKGAVTFARYLGLVIPENVAARFPAPTATPSQDPAGPVAPGDPDQADQTPAPPHESDDIPF